MNYSRSYVKYHNSPKIKKRYSAQRRFVHTLIKTILILILLVIAAGIISFGYYAKTQIDRLPDISQVSIRPTGANTKVVDSDGNVLTDLSAAGANSKYISLDKIPKNLQHAFIATEDSRFYEHNGIDLRSIIRAAFSGLANGGHFSQGASTITQQLLKNNYFSNQTRKNTFSDRLDRKIQEQYLAVQLEKVTSKDKILESYLNTINLGQNTLGVEAAAQRYFNKDVYDLSLSECTVIAGIIKNPTKYDPVTHPKNNAIQRERVLKNMLDQGYITKKAYQTAMDDDVYSRIASVNSDHGEEASSYFIDALTDQVVSDLVKELGISRTEAYMKLYNGGLTIHSTQDVSVQQTVDDEINRKKNYAGGTKYSMSFSLTVDKENGTTKNYTEQTMLKAYRKRDKNYTLNYSSRKEAEEAYEAYKKQVTADGKIPEGGENVVYTLQPQAAMTVIDQRTGQVKAISGGRGKKTGSVNLNRATDITRQPGSAFKVLAAFAPAIDAGGMTLASVEDDAPELYENGREVKNYDGHYHGFTTIREAITDSINVVAVKTLTDIGTGLGYQYVKDFGFSTLEEGDNNQALALGSLIKGVKNIELTAAYAAIANGGYYKRPVFYTTVEDSTGKVILNTTDDKGRRVLKKSTAWLLTSAMKDVMTKGTGQKADFKGMTLAGMSGTSESSSDTQFAGFSPYYTCVVWGGCDDNSAQEDTSYSETIWKAVMRRINKGRKYRGFERPDDIVTALVCKKSGKLPEENVCDHDPRGSMVYNEFFTKDTVPTETCDHHVKLSICRVSGLPAGDFCPKSDIVDKVFITGGSPDTDDEKYMIPAEDTKRICDVHVAPTPPEAAKKNRNQIVLK
ncbi:MAG: transglycosylase domain-containing protein [Lachnospiraceae bacterium]|nr:transglycosylase domain-containing protein [Lachnospiraceae bacterium]